MLKRLFKPNLYAAFPLTALVISLAGTAQAATPPSVTVLTPLVTKHLATPLRLAFDAKGGFVVSDPRMGGVSRFDSQGQFIDTLKTSAPPQGIATTDRGYLLVSQGDAVVMLDQSGNEVGQLGSGAGQFKKANGIAVDAAGYIYVADSQDNNVKIFNAGGQFVRSIGSKGSEPGQFSMPTGIAYEKSTNQIAVADTQNSRIQFFSAAGNYDYVKSIGSFGNNPLQLQLRTPAGVTFDYTASGALNRMYVVDTFTNSVHVIDPAGQGTFLTSIGTNGFSSGQVMVPVDVAFDPTDQRLAVASASGQITMYGIDGGTQSTEHTGLLGVDPLQHVVKTPSITITGTVKAQAAVALKSRTAGLTFSAVEYTSSTTWKCTVSGLSLGSNVIMVTATDSTGAKARHAVSVTYKP